MIDGIVSSVSFEDIQNYRCSTLSAQQAKARLIASKDPFDSKQRLI